MRCPDPRCGTENADGAKFCAACGNRLAPSNGNDSPVDSAAPRICPACGRANAAQARFCGKCGCPLHGEPADAYDEVVEARLEPLAPLPPEADPDVTVIAEAPHSTWHFAETEIAPDQTPAPAPTAGRSGRTAVGASPASALGPMFFVAIGIVAVVAIGIGTWSLLGEPVPPPAKSVPAAATIPPPVVVSPPVAPIADPPPAAPAAVVPAEPPAPAEAAPRPFQSLQTPTPAPTPAAASEPSRNDDSRRAERARKREEARLAREAAAQQAREAALREAEAAAAKPRSPEELCADQSGFLARNSCEARLCQTSEWMFHPFCMKRRSLEEQKRQGSGGSGY